MKALLLIMGLVLSYASFSETSRQELEAKGEELKQKAEEKADKMKANSATKLDDLIRGELAAVKSYDQVLADLKDPNERDKLEAIRKDHKEAVTTLKKFAKKDPEARDEAMAEEGGVWSGFTQAWTGGAKLMGKDTAVKALTQGEKHGINEYEELLKDENVRPELKAKVKNELIPKQQEHLKTLKEFI